MIQFKLLKLRVELKAMLLVSCRNFKSRECLCCKDKEVGWQSASIQAFASTKIAYETTIKCNKFLGEVMHTSTQFKNLLGLLQVAKHLIMNLQSIESYAFI